MHTIGAVVVLQIEYLFVHLVVEFAACEELVGMGKKKEEGEDE